MASKQEAVKTIEGPLQEYIEKNSNAVLAEAFEIPNSKGQYGIRVGIRSIADERRISSLGLGSFAIPPELEVPVDAANVRLAAGRPKVSITTFEVGDLKAFKLITPSGKCPPGYSIGHPRMSAGTLGCLLRWDKSPNNAYILSNQHVLAGNNVGVVGDPIYQPGRYDGGTAFHTIARLAAFINLDHISHNVVDAALARIENDNTPPENWADIVTPVLPFIGTLTGVTDPSVGMVVEKVGRSSERSVGTVEMLDCYAYPDYGPGLGSLKFKGQVRTTPMAIEGDSGSVVIELATKKIVGLLFAGSYSVTVFTPIKNVLSELVKKLGGGSLAPIP